MLTYIGKGAFLENVPARDLNDEEVMHYGQVLLSQIKQEEVGGMTGREALLKSGLYTSVVQEEAATEYVEETPADGRSAKEKK